MRTSKNVTYTSNQFTLADLREIIEEHEYDPDDSHVDLSVDKGDRPFDSDSYSITVRPTKQGW